MKPPAPRISTSSVIVGRGLASVSVPVGKSAIRSGPEFPLALPIAWRSESGPESFVFSTSQSVALAALGASSRAHATVKAPMPFATPRNKLVRTRQRASVLSGRSYQRSVEVQAPGGRMSASRPVALWLGGVPGLDPLLPAALAAAGVGHEQRDHACRGVRE